MTSNDPNETDIVVCRCMEITDREIREALKFGAQTFDDVKRISRAGMGLCQGKTCQHLVERIIAQERGEASKKLPPLSVRPPLRPTKLGVIARMKR